MDPVKGNPNALPVGFSDLGLPGLRIAGRVGGRADVPSTIRVPFASVNSSIASSSQFKDASCAAANDDCLLGQDNGPVLIGIGTGGSFPSGTVFPVTPEGAASTTTLTWGPEGNGGQFPGGAPQLFAVDTAPGPDGIMGCLGDNSQVGGNIPCDRVLGIAVLPGSTGSDDVVQLADFSAAQDGSLVLPSTLARFLIRDPWRRSPVINLTTGTTIKDLSLLGIPNNLDVLTKANTTWCPIDAVTGKANCAQQGYCGDFGGDADRDQHCSNLDDPCNVTPNAFPVGGVGGSPDTNGDGVPDECQCGDCDGNGQIQAADAFAIAICITNPPACACEVAIGDADGNGQLQAGDAFAIALVVTNPAVNPTWGLTCADRPEGTDPAVN
jgi:hypothetical protein